MFLTLFARRVLAIAWPAKRTHSLAYVNAKKISAACKLLRPFHTRLYAYTCLLQHVTDTLRFLQFLGSWYIVQYYASSEEALAYRCMRAELSVSPENAEVTMNFTYSFTDDPINELLVGNITWKIPSSDSPAHWMHAEFPCKQLINS